MHFESRFKPHFRHTFYYPEEEPAAMKARLVAEDQLRLNLARAARQMTIIFVLAMATQFLIRSCSALHCAHHAHAQEVLQQRESRESPQQRAWRTQSKFVICNFTMSQGCYWCSKLKEHTQSRRFKAFLAEQNVEWRDYDVTSSNAKAREQAKEGAQRYGITGFPTMVAQLSMDCTNENDGSPIEIAKEVERRIGAASSTVEQEGQPLGYLELCKFVLDAKAKGEELKLKIAD